MRKAPRSFVNARASIGTAMNATTSLNQNQPVRNRAFAMMEKETAWNASKKDAEVTLNANATMEAVTTGGRTTPVIAAKKSGKAWAIPHLKHAHAIKEVKIVECANNNSLIFSYL